jgi:hypothetical protein
MCSSPCFLLTIRTCRGIMSKTTTLAQLSTIYSCSTQTSSTQSFGPKFWHFPHAMLVDHGSENGYRGYLLPVARLKGYQATSSPNRGRAIDRGRDLCRKHRKVCSLECGVENKEQRTSASTRARINKEDFCRCPVEFAYNLKNWVVSSEEMCSHSTLMGDIYVCTLAVEVSGM